MAEPPPEIAVRRTRQRHRRRRRRIITLCGALAVVAVAAVAGVAALRPTGHSTSSAPAPQTDAPHPAVTAPATVPATTPAQNANAAAGAATIQRLIRPGRPIYCAGHTGNAVAVHL